MEASETQTSPVDAPAPQHWAGLQKRVATSLLLVLLAVPLLWYGSWPLTLALILLALQMNREWESLIPKNCMIWRTVGIFYITIPIICLLTLRNLSFMDSAETALYATLYPIIIVTLTDIAAYFSGRTFGGPKLAPAISPGKTWAGLIGGMAAGSLGAILMLPLLPWPDALPAAALLGASLAVLAQAGDLFESFLKRQFDAKDSGNLLPGHGGVLDRLDGYVFVLPAYLALVLCYMELLP